MTKFEVFPGSTGLQQSFQSEFPASVQCVYCGGHAQPAVTIAEGGQSGGEFLCDLRPEGEGLWPHDACAITVYLCRKCLRATALFNQA